MLALFCVFATLCSTSGQDFDGNGILDHADIDSLLMTIDQWKEGEIDSFDTSFDLNGDQKLTHLDIRSWVQDHANTWIADADLNGEFNTHDFVVVFQAGEYEDDQTNNSRWIEGDWNGDREFNASDFVAAFQSGGCYCPGPRMGEHVPEPHSAMGFVAIAAACAIFRRRD